MGYESQPRRVKAEVLGKRECKLKPSVGKMEVITVMVSVKLLNPTKLLCVKSSSLLLCMWLCWERPHLLYKSLAFTKGVFSCLSLIANSPLSEADLTSITYLFITFLLTIVMWYSWAQSLQLLWSASWFRVLLCVMPPALAAASWIWSFFLCWLSAKHQAKVFILNLQSACPLGFSMCKRLQRESCGCLLCFLAFWSPLESRTGLTREVDPFGPEDFLSLRLHFSGRYLFYLENKSCRFSEYHGLGNKSFSLCVYVSIRS